MLEFVGQTINENGKSYLDVVPAIQFILIVRRLILAYRQELVSSMLRSAERTVLQFVFLFNLKKNKTINFLKLAIMKTLFITALLAITVASCNQKVKESKLQKRQLPTNYMLVLCILKLLAKKVQNVRNVVWN
jgi:hypothetical protein